LESDVVDLLAEEQRPDHKVQDRVQHWIAALQNSPAPRERRWCFATRKNLGPTEIARRMGWSVNALNVALSRARVFLRRCVEESQRAGKSC